MQAHKQQTTHTRIKPSSGGVLQRACACGQHTGNGGECEECKKKREGILQRAALNQKAPVSGAPPAHVFDKRMPGFSHDFSRVSNFTPFAGVLQAKLAINQPGDVYEQEADRIADQVLAAPAQSAVNRTPPRIQRFTGQSSGQAGMAPASVEQALATPGRPLEPALRQDMERRFGCDFSQVRVHSGLAAKKSAQDVNALAYTVGWDIVFGERQFAPTSRVGQRLLAHELTHVLQQDNANQAWGDNSFRSTALPSHEQVQRQPASPPLSEDVWGLPITRSMCGCRQRIRDGIVWANTARATYAACDTPANVTSTDVEACFDSAHPGSSVVASTSSSGTMTLPPSSADPCDRIENKATFVHEIMHSRHTDIMARAQGSAFFREWKRLAGDPDRLDKLRPTFPAQVTAFETQWDDGHDWAQDEVNSYRWERRFLEDALAALNRICQP